MSQPPTYASQLLIGLLFCIGAGPATTQSTQPVESPQATALLTSVREAYLSAQSLRVEGTIHGDFDIAGRQREYKVSFTGIGDGAGRFGGDIKTKDGEPLQIFAANGKQLTLYNARRNSYATAASFAERVPAGELPDAFVALMLDGDASSLLLLCDAPDTLLRLGATKLDVADTPADEPAILLWESADEKRRFFFDSKTRLLQKLEIDYTPLFAARDTNGIKRAVVTITYTRVEPGAVTADSDFAFKPPATASEFVLHVEMMRDVTPPATRPDTP